MWTHHSVIYQDKIHMVVQLTHAHTFEWFITHSFYDIWKQNRTEPFSFTRNTYTQYHVNVLTSPGLKLHLKFIDIGIFLFFFLTFQYMIPFTKHFEHFNRLSSYTTPTIWQIKKMCSVPWLGDILFGMCVSDNDCVLFVVRKRVYSPDSNDNTNFMKDWLDSIDM